MAVLRKSRANKNAVAAYEGQPPRSGLVQRDVDRRIFWQSQLIRPDKPELRLWLRISPVSGKPYAAEVGKGFS